MTIEEYRERYGLPGDYPSLAASYSEQRAALAKKYGLGLRRLQTTSKLSLVSETPAASVKARRTKKNLTTSAAE